jgi:DNA invertase Pin-like site-specific DNA recombinase
MNRSEIDEKKVAVYIRLAREDSQESAPEIEQQKEMLRQYAQQHGFDEPVCYVDNGFSGLTLDRPAFSEMEEAIRAGCIHTVLVRDISRIGRDMLLAHHWIDGLGERGVKLIAADGSHETPDYPDIRAAIAEYMRRRGKQRT